MLNSYRQFWIYFSFHGDENDRLVTIFPIQWHMLLIITVRGGRALFHIEGEDFPFIFNME